MKIVVCSKNKAKNAAVCNVLNEFFDNYETISLDTNSKVSETPMSHEEGIDGCINRINDALNQVSDADLYIAIMKHFYVDGLLYMIDLIKNIPMDVVHKYMYQMIL